uniref:PHB domain-containing protein n=1 Tax=Macrostomum lignano TaxID=282301 RepID=A0A1I8ITQ5_9PLAT
GCLADFLKLRTQLRLTTIRKLLAGLGFGLKAIFFVALGFAQRCHLGHRAAVHGAGRELQAASAVHSVRATSQHCQNVTLPCVSTGSRFSGLAVAGYAVNVIDLAPNFSGLVMGFANSISTFTGMMSTVIASLIVQSSGNSERVKLEWQVALSSAAATQVLAGVVYLVFASAEEQPWTFETEATTADIQSATSLDCLHIGAESALRLSHNLFIDGAGVMWNKTCQITGGCTGQNRVRRIIGGWGWACCCVTQVQRLTLEVFTLKPKCEDVETSEGVAVTVTGVAQVKVMRDPEILTTACEQFLGKSRRSMEDTILQTMEGHLRAILGTLTVEAIYKDRDQFAELVRDVAAPDVGKMGIEILSFTIKDIYDRVDYLNSLGRTQTAIVKRDAAIGSAESERDAGIVESQCQRSRMEVRYEMDSRIADSARHFQIQKADFDVEVNRAKAQAELAYNLQSAKERQRIRTEEIEIDVREKRKLIEIEEKEIIRNEKELDAIVRRPAEAQAFQVQTIAAGDRYRQVKVAQAEAEAIRVRGAAEAASIEAVGKAQAEEMRLKASAFRAYGDAAVLELTLDALPKVAAEVAAPLARIDEIVVLGDDRTTSEVSRLLSSLPPAVQALTGVDLSKAIGRLPGATVAGSA